jgi:hypothetical protein
MIKVPFYKYVAQTVIKYVALKAGWKIFNNNYFLPESVDKVQFRKSKKRNNPLRLVLEPFYSSHTRRKIDRRLLAYFLLFYVRNLDR